MKISELFRRLSFGELSNLAISGEGSGTIIEPKHPQIIQYCNDGLLKIFSRFLLQEKDLLIEMVEGVTSYHLKRQYAESSNSDETWVYIKDLPGDPFLEDVIKILAVYGPDGDKLPLNDASREDSLFTPAPDVIQVPYPIGGLALGVLYQARHLPLLDAGETYLEQKIRIPFFLEKALTSYIGHQVFSHMNGPENLLKSQEYEAAYENICAEAEAKDLVNQTFHTTHSKLEQRGFV